MARYAIQADRSTVTMNARSTVHPIDAVTSGLEGYFEAEFGTDGRLDLRSRPSGRLELAVDLLTSSNPLYDREMKRRIDARRFPAISGDLTGVTAGSEPDRYVVEGDVTFRGQTGHFADEMTITWVDDDTVSLEGSHTFDIRDFKMEAPRIFLLKVFPDVAIAVSILAKAGA